MRDVRHEPTNNTDRALNLRQSVNPNTEIIAPEWHSFGATGINPTGNDGSGGDVTVTIDTATGVSNGPAAKAVNGISGFAKLTSSSNLAATVLREMAAFRWQIAGVAGKEMVKQEVFKAQDIKMYTVLDVPRTPWDVVDNPTADDKNQPWVTALEFATDPGKGNATGKYAAGALAAITDFLFNGHGLIYACRDGLPQYAYFHAGPTWSINLSGYMSKNLGASINCYDQTAAVSVLGLLLGINLEFCRMAPFGYINATRFVGITGDVNNPFFERQNPPMQKLVGVDEVEPNRSYFTSHGFTRYSSNIYDACAGPHLGIEQATYLSTMIDTAATNEPRKLYDVRFNEQFQHRMAGNSGDITVIPYNTTVGIT